jgi:ParB family chromosome partitioning protein
MTDMNAAATAEKNNSPKRGLGRGLDSLFGEDKLRAVLEKPASAQATVQAPEAAPTPQTTSAVQQPQQASQRTLPITALVPSPVQPRRLFNQLELESLADSIRAHGILQPLLVRPSENQKGKFEIIAGERRWRASQIARLHDVPVVVQAMEDREALEIALIENVQRADLSPVEEAEGYQRLIDEFRHSQDELAKVVGKSRGHISNMLRLLDLPQSVRDLVHRGHLSAGHARQLLGMDAAAERIANHVVRKKLSVRQTEKFITRLKSGKTPQAPKRKTDVVAAVHSLLMTGKMPSAPKDADVIALEAEMGTLLGLKVDIQSNDEGQGVLGIHFSSLDQLDDLLQKLTRSSRRAEG